VTVITEETPIHIFTCSGESFIHSVSFIHTETPAVARNNYITAIAVQKSLNTLV